MYIISLLIKILGHWRVQEK